MNRRNLGYVIALSALLISIPRYVATFAGIDAVPLTAYGMGILLAGGAAYIVDAWADATKRGVKRTGSLLLVLAVNLAYEPMLLTPFVLARLWSEPLAQVMSPAYAVFWSIMVTLAPVLLVFGVVYAVWFHKQPTVRNESEQKAEHVERKANEVKNEQPVVPAFVCSVCGVTKDSRNALAGHMNAHRTGNGHGRTEAVVLEREEA